MRKWIVLLLAVLALMLASCSEEFELRTYPVRFVINGQVQEQTVVQEEYPRIPDVDGTDPAFVGWQDEQGQMVEPDMMAVTREVTYTAVFQPQLTSQCPYLFVDEQGMLRPDELITYGEVKAALEALCSADAQIYYPEMPGDDEDVTDRGMHNILGWFFDKARLPQMPADYVTRAQFAVVMDDLLGWPEAERVSIDPDAVLPRDVSADRADHEALLRASVAYTADPDGVSWKLLDLSVVHEPGFVNVDGYLYCVEEDGTFLRNGDVGLLHFDETGRFSLGDAELDAQVAEYLKGVLETNPEATRLEILRIVFDHCYQDFGYQRKGAYLMGETGWEIEDAKEMLADGQGDCYNFAAVFWAHARMLGYQARAISGTCTKANRAHSWVIINIDGEDYFFDPQWQYDYIDQDITDKDMFQIHRSKIKYWNYKWKE